MENKRIECEICKQEFKNKNSLSTHIKNRHKISKREKQADVTQSLTDFSIILGYRSEDDVLLYFSAQMTNHKANLTLESDEASLDGKKINLSSKV